MSTQIALAWHDGAVNDITVVEYADSGEVLARLTVQCASREEQAAEELIALGASNTGAFVLPDNTTDWGPFTRLNAQAIPGRWPVSISWVREVTTPWRRGFGYSVQWGTKRSTYAVWWRGKPPKSPDVDIDLVHLGNTAPGDLL